MPLNHFTKVFGVKDCAVYPLTADVTGGGNPTYGSKIDVPGVKSLAFAGTLQYKTLRGDNKLLDSDSVLTSVDVTLTSAKADLDIWKNLMGATMADTGSTPNQKALLTQKGADRVGYMKLEAQVASSDLVNGDVHLRWWKVKVSDFPDYGFAEEDYKFFTVKLTSLPCASNDAWYDIEINETAVAIV